MASFKDDLVRERDRLQEQLDAINTLVTFYAEPASGWDKYPKEFMTRNHAKRVQHCGNCGKTGHLITSCPEKNRSIIPIARTRVCSRCRKPGHRSTTCPMKSSSHHPAMPMPANVRELSREDLKAKIQAMKDEGMNSAQMSKELCIPLATINKHWPTTKEDDDDTRGGLETI